MKTAIWIILFAFVLVCACAAFNAVSANEGTSIALRADYLNGQTSYFVAPEHFFNQHAGIAGAGVFDSTGASAVAGGVFQIFNFKIYPLVGAGLDAATGDLTHWKAEGHIFWNSKWAEATVTNFGNYKAADDQVNKYFLRAWVMAGRKDWHFRLGGQVESLNLQDDQNKWQRAITHVGPKGSLFINCVRLDLFYGLVAQDMTTDINDDTDPVVRFWAWYFYK